MNGPWQDQARQGSGGYPGKRTDAASWSRPRRLFPIAITPIGAGALALAVLIAGAAINTGTNLLYLMLSTLFAFLFASVNFAAFNLRRLSIRRDPPAAVHAGDTVTIAVELINRSRWFWAWGIEVSDEIASPNPGPRRAVAVRTFFHSVRPGNTTRKNVEVTFPWRGKTTMGSPYLISCFPFGFLEERTRRQLNHEILVYPRLVDLSDHLRSTALSNGMVETPLKGNGSGLYSIRNYVPGDPAKSIHWKLSAKGSGLKVREHEHEEHRRVRLVVSPGVVPNPGPDELKVFETALSVAASFVRFFEQRDFEIAMWTPAGSVGFGRTPSHIRHILSTLALARADHFAPGTEPQHPGTSPDGTINLLITGTEAVS